VEHMPQESKNLGLILSSSQTTRLTANLQICGIEHDLLFAIKPASMMVIREKTKLLSTPLICKPGFKKLVCYSQVSLIDI